MSETYEKITHFERNYDGFIVTVLTGLIIAEK